MSRAIDAMRAARLVAHEQRRDGLDGRLTRDPRRADHGRPNAWVGIALPRQEPSFLGALSKYRGAYVDCSGQAGGAWERPLRLVRALRLGQAAPRTGVHGPRKRGGCMHDGARPVEIEAGHTYHNLYSAVHRAHKSAVHRAHKEAPEMGGFTAGALIFLAFWLTSA